MYNIVFYLLMKPYLVNFLFLLCYFGKKTNFRFVLNIGEN